jgi:hypothetical protein
MDKRSFVQIIRKAAPQNRTFKNLSRGTSTIISYSDANIYYQCGSARISISYNHLLGVYEIFHNTMVTSTELKKHNPSVFYSKENPLGRRGHDCNCTFLFSRVRGRWISGPHRRWGC